MGSYASPEEAYWAFFDRFNARDAVGWAGVMSYPHVRVSPARDDAAPRTTSRVFANGEEYAAQAPTAFERIAATGWVRTEGIEPVRVHEADDRVHLAGGWTRYNADDRPILTNRVSYILTRLDEGWGIQARFGIDSFAEGTDTSASEGAAMALAEHSITTINAGDREAYSSLYAFPLVTVGVGTVQVTESAEGLRYPFADGTKLAIESRVIQAGATAVNLAAEVRGDGTTFDELVLMTAHRGAWGIHALSVITR